MNRKRMRKLNLIFSIHLCKFASAIQKINYFLVMKIKHFALKARSHIMFTFVSISVFVSVSVCVKM